MMRYALHLLAVVAFAMVIPQLVRAMGPTSAALKNQRVQTAAANPPAITAPMPHRRSKHNAR
jgi:hypothetical protein